MKIPKWINIISTLIALLSLFVGASLYISPNTFITNVDFSAEGTLFLVYMWAARQIAIGAIILYSVVKQSHPMLKISLIAYILMNLQDIIIGISQNDVGLIAGSLFFSILATTIVSRLKSN